MRDARGNPLLAARDQLVRGQPLGHEAELLRRDFSYAVPTDDAISVLAELGPLIEVGAGLGYWAALIEHAGGSVLAFDDPVFVTGYTSGGPYFDVRSGGAEQVPRHPGRTLLLCWPPRADPLAGECLQAYRGERLAYVGPDGDIRHHAGDERFHAALEADFERCQIVELPQWPEAALHGSLRLYRRRPA